MKGSSLYDTTKGSPHAPPRRHTHAHMRVHTRAHLHAFIAQAGAQAHAVLPFQGKNKPLYPEEGHLKGQAHSGVGGVQRSASPQRTWGRGREVYGGRIICNVPCKRHRAILPGTSSRDFQERPAFLSNAFWSRNSLPPSLPLSLSLHGYSKLGLVLKWASFI